MAGTDRSGRRSRARWRAILVLTGALLGGPCLRAEPVPALPWLRAQGAALVDERGEPVILRGCNLGGWLLLEMWMIDQPGLRDQQELVSLLERRFGAAEARRLLDLYREHFVTDRDFEILRSFGFNVVRVPFDYRLLEDDAQPRQLRPDAFRWLDRAVELARRHGCYVILDLHGAPGGQSTDHATGQAGENRLWRERALQDRVVWLWGEIAAHYASEPAVAGYDILNEPFGDYRTGEHLQPLVELMGRVYEAVRAADARHLLFLGGPQQGIECYGDPAARGWSNIAFTEHYYPGLHGDHEALETHARFLGRKLRARAEYLAGLRVPFLVGEFNVVLARLGGVWMTRRYFDEYAARGWAATLWSYKLLRREGGVGADNWFMVTNRKPLPPLDFQNDPTDAVEAWCRGLGDQPLAVNEALREALTTAHPQPLALAAYPPILTAAPAHDAWAGWTGTDVGGSLAGGQRVAGSDGLDLFGGGRDIWNDHDQFRFLWRPVASRFELTTRVEAVGDTSPYAKAGLMWRAGLGPDAAHVLLHVFPDGQLVLGWRARTGATMQERKIRLGPLPVYLRLARADHGLEIAWSEDGRTWTAIDPPLLDGDAADGAAGFAALGHDNNESLTSASFRDVRAFFPDGLDTGDGR